MDINISEIKKTVEDYKRSNRDVEKIIKNLVNSCCSELDDLICQIQEAVKDFDNPITDEELDYFILNLPIQVYYAYEQQELIGLAEDRAKRDKTGIYNDVFLSSDGTVADRKQKAENSVQQAQMIINIYSRAGKQIRSKLDIATETLQSLKKVSTRRMAERSMESSAIHRVREDF